MDTSLKRNSRRPRLPDLFRRAQGSLTWLYTSLMTLFLALFVVIVYTLLSYVIMSEQRSNLLDLVRQQAGDLRQQLESNPQLDRLDIDNQRIRQAGNDILFYYFVRSDGMLAAGSELFPSLQSDLLNLIQNWPARPGEVRYGTIATATDGDPPKGRPGRPLLDKSSDLRLMITGEPVMTAQGNAGTLYIGINVTSRYRLFHWLLVILIGLAVLFVFLAFWISRFMSRKAMVPVVSSYTRQRQFLVDASHELRTPLSVMLSSIDALKLETTGAESPSPFSTRTLDSMKDEVKRMAAMVGDLLLLARSESGEVELNRQQFDYRPAAERTIQSMEMLASAKRITIKLQAPENVPAYGDADKLMQMLYILLDNAIKYSPKGGQIRVKLAGSTSGRNRTFRMSVQDTGPGIAPEDAERVFDRFYRADKARTREESGHGLGLSIAKWIATAHGGKISATGKKGQGSTFYVVIPIPQK